MFPEKTYRFLRIGTLILALFIYSQGFSQFYNKEVAAEINMENRGEFLSFNATAENKTPSDLNLRYEFLIFKKDQQDNIAKTDQGNLFFLEAHEKKILSNTTINQNDEGTVTILLMIYDLEDKPLGKDRLELEIKAGVVSEAVKEEPLVISQEEAAPQDGFILDGLVIENAITKAGRDFYKYFYSEYYNKQITTPRNIEIEEVPGRGRVTRISVKIEGQVVLQFFAQPRKEFLKQMASVALSRSVAYLQQLEQQEANFKYY